MAKSGHSSSQSRQPVQASGRVTTTLSLPPIARQYSGHTRTQISHAWPLHQRSVTSSCGGVARAWPSGRPLGAAVARAACAKVSSG